MHMAVGKGQPYCLFERSASLTVTCTQRLPGTHSTRPAAPCKHFVNPGLRLVPPGMYSLKFELPSFTTLLRQDIQMSAGFTATINAVLQVSTVQDTVTVSGQSPVVDVENATVSTTFNTTLAAILPNPYDYNAILAVTPGLQVVTPDVGGSRAHIQQTIRSWSRL